MNDIYSGPEMAGYVIGVLFVWVGMGSIPVFIFLTWLNSRKIWRKINKR